MDKVRALTLLEDRVRRLAELQAEVDAALVAAKDEAGATLADIAAALGVETPQAARSRLLTARARQERKNDE